MKKVLINVEERELRVAILDDEQLVELYIESLDEKSILNNIYKGRVEDILPGLKAAFVNVGLDRNAFLHFDDVRPDLIWAKYRELHPELADEVPTAREALAEPVELEQEDDGSENGDKRKRRRGRRGGKKRRPDSEDTYSPGLPVGVTEDDLDDEDDDDNDVTPVAARSYEAPAQSIAAAPVQQDEQDDDEKDAEEVAEEVAATPAESAGDGSSAAADAEAEARRLSRQERQRQRRERWEQRKLERQQRRQQERAERGAGGGMQASVEPGNEAVPAAAEDAYEPAVESIPEPVLPPPAYGTRGAASAYDTFSTQMTANQRRQNKMRYGDNFGNIALPNDRKQDHRDSQLDFFGPAVLATDEQYSVWDERQPNLGPVPGLGKQFLGIEGNTRRRDRRPAGRDGGNRPQANSDNQQNRHKKPMGGKRRGGKKRSMRKRDNRSYFAFSADDLEKEIPAAIEETAAEATPVKKTRTRKVASADGEAAPKKTTRKPAARKTPAKKAADTEAQELPLDIPVAEADGTAVAEKPKRTRKAAGTATRTRKTAATKAADKSAESGSDAVETAGQTEAAPDVVPEPSQASTQDFIKAEPVAEKPEAAPAQQDIPAAEQTSEAPVHAGQQAVEPAAPSEAPSEPTAAPMGSGTEVSTERQVSTASTEQGYSAGNAPAHMESQSITSGAPDDSAFSAGDAAEGAAEQRQTDRNARPRRNGRLSRAERAARHRLRKAEAAVNGESAQGDGESAPATDARRRPDDSARIEEFQSPAPGPAPAPSQAQAPAVVTAQAPAPVPQSGQSKRDRERERDRDRDQRRRLRKPSFQEVFRKGDEIMVQVVKEEIGMKGARISSYVSLPGRYLVLLPYPNQEGGISRKVEDIKERKRLKTLLRDISSDETAFIVRTAGVFQDEKEIRNDVEFLSHEWKTIAEKFAKCEPKSLVYDDHDILYRLARDVFDDSVSEILIDSHVEAEKLKGILGKLIPNLVDKVKLYSGAENIFHKFGVNKQIQKAARRKVWLKSGGYLIIDEAEALTAIDVNTGKSVGKDDQEKLILRTNLEAARAVPRELKLRDIGGLIVIDFIDMKDARNKEQVLNELKMQLRKDRSKTSVSAISEFGLVEMTRKRVRRSLRKTIFMDCPYCQGAGAVLNEQQIWLHMKHEIVRQLESSKPAPTLNITVNPKIRAYVDQSYRDVLRRLEQKYDTEIRITMSDIFHIENYQIEKLETTGVINGSATVPDR